MNQSLSKRTHISTMETDEPSRSKYTTVDFLSVSTNSNNHNNHDDHVVDGQNPVADNNNNVGGGGGSSNGRNPDIINEQQMKLQNLHLSNNNGKEEQWCQQQQQQQQQQQEQQYQEDQQQSQLIIDKNTTTGEETIRKSSMIDEEEQQQSIQQKQHHHQQEAYNSTHHQQEAYSTHETTTSQSQQQQQQQQQLHHYLQQQAYIEAMQQMQQRQQQQQHPSPNIYQYAQQNKWEEVLQLCRMYPYDVTYVNPIDNTNILHLAVMSRTGYGSSNNNNNIVEYGSSNDDLEEKEKDDDDTDDSSTDSTDDDDIVTKPSSIIASLDVIEEILRIYPDSATIRCNVNSYTPLAYVCLVSSTNNDSHLEDAATMARLFIQYCPSSLRILQGSSNNLSALDIHIITYSNTKKQRQQNHHQDKEKNNNDNVDNDNDLLSGRTTTIVLRTLLEADPTLAQVRISADKVSGPIELLYRCNSDAFLEAVKNCDKDDDDDNDNNNNSSSSFSLSSHRSSLSSINSGDGDGGGSNRSINSRRQRFGLLGAKKKSSLLSSIPDDEDDDDNNNPTTITAPSSSKNNNAPPRRSASLFSEESTSSSICSFSSLRRRNSLGASTTTNNNSSSFRSSRSNSTRSCNNSDDKTKRVIKKITDWWVWKWTILILKYGTLPNKKPGTPFSAVQAATDMIGCPIPVLTLAMKAFPKQIKDRIIVNTKTDLGSNNSNHNDSSRSNNSNGSNSNNSSSSSKDVRHKCDLGNYPLHDVCMWPCQQDYLSTDPIISKRKASAIIALLKEYSDAANFTNTMDQTPLELALLSGTMWDNGTRKLVKACKKSLSVISPTTNLYPFMTAAAISTITEDQVYVYQYQYQQQQQIYYHQSQQQQQQISSTVFLQQLQKIINKREIQFVRTIYGLLRADPTVLINCFVNDTMK